MRRLPCLDGRGPESLVQLDRYFAAATIAHEYISDLHRELVIVGGGDEETRELLAESAAVVLERMPALTEELRRLERQSGEQQLLDPGEAQHTLGVIETALGEVEPELSALRTRQDEIAAALRDRITRAQR